MEDTQMPDDEIVHFLRKRDYKFIKELGRGACGKTVLLFDDQIDEYFVCKKYAPQNEDDRQTLFTSFVREIKLLHQVHNNNVVRVFNYYLYPDKLSGYILMEFIDGDDLEKYAKESPDQVNDLFLQAVDGFSYLERSGILHRDIRPGNLLVTKEGQLKIIDLGFGKKVATSVDFEKSITLNWWCKTPNEFVNGRYDFTTEVYFVGKLFERLIQENNISQFKHLDILQRMCRENHEDRIRSFTETEKNVRSDQFTEVNFTSGETWTYRSFAEALTAIVSKIANSAKYKSDITAIQAQLSEIYRSSMLEALIPDSQRIIGCFVDGAYYYKTKVTIPTEYIRNFLKLIKSCSPEQNKIIIANLQTRLDTIERFDKQEVITDDDIPF
jgi:eukaryotic-like serine/threonine-protein kinase